MLGPFYHMTSGYISRLTIKGALALGLWPIHKIQLLCPRTPNRQTQMAQGSMILDTPLDPHLLSTRTLTFESLHLLSFDLSQITTYLKCVYLLHASLPDPMAWICSTLHNFAKITLFSWKVFQSYNSYIS